MKKCLAIGTTLVALVVAIAPAFAASTDIITDVKAAIDGSQDIGEYDIQIGSRGDKIILTGTAASEDVAEQLDKIASAAASKKTIRNFILADPAAIPAGEVRNIVRYDEQQPTDQELRATLQKKIMAESEVAAKDVNISVNNGIVSVAGTQKSFRQVDQVLTALLNTQGVKDVKSSLQVQGGSYPAQSFKK